jgi:hypothetical protein
VKYIKCLQEIAFQPGEEPMAFERRNIDCGVSKNLIHFLGVELFTEIQSPIETLEFIDVIPRIFGIGAQELGKEP